MQARLVDLNESPDSLWGPAFRSLPVPGIRQMINTASEMEDVVHLSLGQPNFAAPDHIIDAHIDALRERKTGYTMDAGLPELLTALKEYYGERYGRQITEDNILITTGCTEAMYLALSAAAAPGRQFIIPDPAFPIYAPIIRMHGGEVRSIPTRAENGHQLDPQEVIDNFRLHTFGVVLNSPANPTGAVYPRETIEAIVEAAAYRDIYVFSDEVYDHLLLDDVDTGSVLQCATDLDHVVAASSFSKTWAMPGLRVGWVISSQGHIKKLRRYHTFTTTVANTPAQWAGVAALKGPRESVDDMVKAYRKRRDRVVELVEETPHLKGYKPQGAFYMLPELPPSMDGTTVAMRLLEEAGVCTIPGSAFGESCNNSLRLSFSTSNEDIEEAFSRMNKWFRDLKV